MKTGLLTILLCLTFSVSRSQNDNSESTKGIAFREGKLKDILRIAGTEKKYVFVEVYTSWCKFCRLLEQDIFPTETAGSYMNKRFVSARYNAEQGEGYALVRRYKINRYPTMLILDTSGKEVGRVIGGARDAIDFIVRVQVALKDLE